MFNIMYTVLLWFRLVGFFAGVRIVCLVEVLFSCFVGLGFFACFLSIPSDDSIDRLKTPKTTERLRLEVTSGDHLNSNALLKGDHIQVVFQYLQGYCTTSLSNTLGNQSQHRSFSFCKTRNSSFSNLCPFPPLSLGIWFICFPSHQVFTRIGIKPMLRNC